jgi:hypothetical protein
MCKAYISLINGNYVDTVFKTKEEALITLLNPRTNVGEYIIVDNVYIRQSWIVYISLEEVDEITI